MMTYRMMECPHTGILGHVITAGNVIVMMEMSPNGT
jgi:hypothetical protein